MAWAHEMRRVHDRLRAALDFAREAAETGRPPDQPDRDQLLYCWGFCLALTGHNRGEDTVLFPALVAADPALADPIHALARDHRMLDHLIGSYQRALEQQAKPADLLRHLEGIGAVLETHFRYEERVLLPRLEGLQLDATSTEAYGPLAR